MTEVPSEGFRDVILALSRIISFCYEVKIVTQIFTSIVRLSLWTQIVPEKKRQSSFRLEGRYRESREILSQRRLWRRTKERWGTYPKIQKEYNSLYPRDLSGFIKDGDSEGNSRRDMDLTGTKNGSRCLVNLWIDKVKSRRTKVFGKDSGVSGFTGRSQVRVCGPGKVRPGVVSGETNRELHILRE